MNDFPLLDLVTAFPRLQEFVDARYERVMYPPAALIRRHGLRPGDLATGTATPSRPAAGQRGRRDEQMIDDDRRKCPWPECAVDRDGGDEVLLADEPAGDEDGRELSKSIVWGGFMLSAGGELRIAPGNDVHHPREAGNRGAGATIRTTTGFTP